MTKQNKSKRDHVTSYHPISTIVSYTNCNSTEIINVPRMQRYENGIVLSVTFDGHLFTITMGRDITKIFN